MLNIQCMLCVVFHKQFKKQLGNMGTYKYATGLRTLQHRATGPIRAEATYNHVFSLNSHKAIRSSNIAFKVQKR